jgi:protein O-mannosyl-transferase
MGQAHKRQTRKSVSAPGVSHTAFWWHVAILLVAGGLTYANSLAGPFIFDDRASIIDNKQIEDLADLSRVLSPPHETPVAGRPVANLTLAINYAIGERNVAGYHVANIALHVLCALVLYGVLRRLTHQPHLAFATALLWMVHPLNSEVVNYITQRTESLLALWYLLTVYASLRALDPRRRVQWTITAVMCCALGMASKESMVTAPVMIAAIDRVFAFPSWSAAWRARGRLYAALAATWLILIPVATGARNLSAGFSTYDAAPWSYFLNQAQLVVHYMYLAIWPRALAIYYGWPRALSLNDVSPQLLLLVALGIATVAALRREARLGIAGLWFFVTLAPTSSFVPIATEVGAERRMYLPLIGVVVLGVAFARWLRQAVAARLPRPPSPDLTRWVGAGALTAVALALGIGTALRSREYASALTLAETTLARWPTPAAHSVYGTELAAAGRFREAEPELRLAASEFPPARYYLGIVLAAEGRSADAEAQFLAFVNDQPDPLDQVRLARLAIADLMMKQQRWADATTQYERVLSIREGDVETRALLANALVRQQRYAEAIVQYRLYLARIPDNTIALAGLGIALISTGNVEEAIRTFRRAVELEPGNANAQQNLARALAMRGKGF